jgi:oligo-1,6-glucosidase
VRAWWKEAVFYQIYPRSFKDSNGDGIGDLKGITEKLDYLKKLGVDAIWLSPVYDSPNDDNGYDIWDYRKIMREFGSMQDFDQLLDQVHARDMRLIMDLVVNHTSDEHRWFKESLSEPSSKYGDYYIFRVKPNNWTSFFSGSAWNYYKERNQYALHLFSKKQMDLNWENPDVREEVKDLVKWWLHKGVDGFRMDVINYISKRPGLPDGDENIGKLMKFTGVEHYFYGPKLHKYLHELKKDAFMPYKAFSVGETPGVGMEMSKLLTGDYRQELDMVFSFDHLETPGHTRYDDYRYDLNYYKDYMIDWMENYGSHCQTSLFFENHDNPRMISKINPDPKYRVVIAKLLATMQMTLKGTPFVFQGQEIGMINQDFSSIDDLRDVEALNMYDELKDSMGEEVAFDRLIAGTRDHARTPMQWTSGKNEGFSEGTPWIKAGSDCSICNAQGEMKDEDSVWSYYKKIIKLRGNHKAFTYGTIEIVEKKNKDLFTYYRKEGEETFFVECHLTE